MQTTRAIVFDAFGTLIRYTARRAPYDRLVDAAGRPMDRLACLTRDVPLATLATEVGVAENLDLMLPDLADELSGLRLFPEVPDVLAKARAAGLRLAVCSNLAYEYGAAVRALVPDLDAYVLSYGVGVANPHPAMSRLSCAELACAAYSGAIAPPVPVQTRHQFQFKPASRSSPNPPVIPARCRHPDVVGKSGWSDAGGLLRASAPRSAEAATQSYFCIESSSAFAALEVDCSSGLWLAASSFVT